MKAYAIFSGGGVKGAALAGCLQAMQERNIEIVGYGGTSAGSLVALLGALGYQGSEIKDLMKGPLRPKNFLDDEGVRFEKILVAVEKLTSVKFLFSKFFSISMLQHFFSIRHLFSAIKYNGLYDGTRLDKIIMDVLSEKGQFKQDETVDFGKFFNVTGRELKIVASNLLQRKAVVFSRDSENSNISITDAIRASTSYPFLFKPKSINENLVLSDGGLASNFPSFLFHKEQAQDFYPVIGFDLVGTSSDKSDNYTFPRHLKDLLGTALEAGDHLIRDQSGTHRVEVEVPVGINTLDFDIAPEQVDRLYDRGFVAATRFLNQWERFKLISEPGLTIQERLRFYYGNPNLFQLPLGSLVSTIQDITLADSCRSCIMLPTGRSSETHMVVYHTFNDDPDEALELSKFCGVSGKVFESGLPVLGDNRSADLEEQQVASVKVDRASFFCVPIFSANCVEKTQKCDPAPKAIGVLCLDSSTPLKKTGWVAGSVDDDNITPEETVLTIMVRWAEVLGRLLNPSQVMIE